MAKSRGRLALLVDPSPAQRRSLWMHLRHEGYEILEASTVGQATAIIARRRPDIVISEWMLPDGTGIELCQMVRERVSDGYCYFILLTAKSGKEDVQIGLLAGADEFMVKPVASGQLLARLTVAERILDMDARLRASNANLQMTINQLSEAHAALDRDLADASALQQNLVRERCGVLGDLRISLLLRPAGHIGGDMVGFFPINCSRAGIYALDVSGHGVAAELLTARLAAQLSDSLDQNVALHLTELGLYDARSPVELAGVLNRQMLDDLRTESYYTMVYADANLLNGQIRFVQAGHPHPFLQRATGEIEKIGDGGLPIGIVPDARFHEVAVQLNPGDRLFIASDGITDCENPAGQPLGEDGLRAILQTNHTLRGTAFIESLAWSVANYCRGRRIDDVSAVLIERLAPGEAAD